MNLSAFRKAANSAGTAVFAVEVRIIDYIGINRVLAAILGKLLAGFPTIRLFSGKCHLALLCNATFVV